VALVFTIGVLAAKTIEAKDLPTIFFAALLFGLAMNAYSLAWTTIFSDSKLSSQIGSVTILIPVSVVIALVPDHVAATYVFYFLPPTPMIIIVTHLITPEYVQDFSIWASFLALILCIPFYFSLFMYLD